MPKGGITLPFSALRRVHAQWEREGRKQVGPEFVYRVLEADDGIMGQLYWVDRIIKWRNDTKGSS